MLLRRHSNVNEAWLMGYDAPMERVYSELLASIAEDNKSSRTAAVGGGYAEPMAQSTVSIPLTAATIKKGHPALL